MREQDWTHPFLLAVIRGPVSWLNTWQDGQLHVKRKGENERKTPVTNIVTLGYREQNSEVQYENKEKREGAIIIITYEHYHHRHCNDEI